MQFNSLEICAGAGGQALGLERAGFTHAALVEIEPAACQTLRLNRPHWNIIETDVRQFDGSPYRNIDLLAGGVPCPPFSKAGKQLGADDERDLFPEAIRLTKETAPKAIMLENVRGLLDPKFREYRERITQQFAELGYVGDWKLLYAADFGVSQLRPRVIFVALQQQYAPFFRWPESTGITPPTVGELLVDLMAQDGWPQAHEWHLSANQIAPTLVGGSKKHGGADLGPTRSKRAWAELGVDGSGLWDTSPPKDFIGMPRLTARMAARVQGFPDSWQFFGKKTPAYRQIGNAFPPPVAEAVGKQIIKALKKES
ncbi:DNA (cytosine-5-)-methyltransferase [Neisseria brasiliensis]|uniref:DNA cytosine methyltransferase n=1 Tax=Neisseria TaxID=482 RepID=UPI000C27A491|nr:MULTISPECIES: DNA cytosine methyltransferase [Neisseria]PJO78364.1 DNA (cytosine-5-)-methyltransferase [Neisseria sp. N177_16]QGL24098.1 DNA (cytosine-5-)-methyltransferase [Neisseria brasiliensis]